MSRNMYERLYSVFSDEGFLNSERIRNEAPLYIQPYKAEQEDEVAGIIRDLGARLQNNGRKVLHIEMFQLCLEILRETGRLDKILEKEPELTPKKMLQLLNGRLDVKRVLIPRLEQHMGEDGTQLTFLSGFGHLYPFLRTHTIIENLYTVLPRHPVVFFFPGEYTYNSHSGSQLSLFGKQSKGHYRAINLDTY